MISKKLAKARQYEEQMEKTIAPDERPAFHLSPRVGWMNDPNGFCTYQGKYHMFYQYHPYDVFWGPMHWGHAVSADMLHWEYVPVGIAPDMPYDQDGCFSGSAIETPDGKLLLMYTSVKREEQPDGTMADRQTQSIAIGDGIDFEKYEGNPVLDQQDLPVDAVKCDFRDPKIIRLPDGTYQALIGSRPADGSGSILLYSSPDALHWKFEKVLIMNHNRYGKMWECPDFFTLDGKQVILVSPQEMLSTNFKFPNGHISLGIIGDYDEKTCDFTEEKIQMLDYGIDFYAPQSVLTEDGRRVMIGWLQNWDSCNLRTKEVKWFGQMTLPRELTIRNGKLYQQPVRELEQMRDNKVVLENLEVSAPVCCENLRGRCIDMELEIRPKDAEKLYHDFTVSVARDDTFHTDLTYTPSKGLVDIDRRFSGVSRAVLHQRSCPVNCENGVIKMRVILDRFSVEVFINDGEQVFTTAIETDLSADRIAFCADGEAIVNVVKYDLK